MKKIMFGLAAAIAMVAAADIVSANIVGYNTTDAQNNKFYIVGVQFEDMQGAVKIDAIVSGTKGVDWDEDDVWMDTASQIQVPSAAGYTTYYYLNDGTYNEAGDTKAGWCNANAEIVDDEFIPGVSVWFKSKTGDCGMTQSGQVPASDQVSVACAASVFSLKANPFPVAFSLNDTSKVAFDGIVGVDWDEEDAWMNTAPQIQVPSAAGYTTYYYLNDGTYNEAGDTKAGWCNANAEIVDDIVPVAQGFWVKPVTGAFNMVFKK